MSNNIYIPALAVASNVEEQNASNRFEGEKPFGSTSDTISVTVDSSGSNRVMIVASSGDDDPTGITFNGDAFTRIDGVSASGIEVSQWILVNPDVGTFDLVYTGEIFPDLTFSGTVFINVDQATPTSGINTSTGAGTSHSTTLTTPTTDMLISISGCGSLQTGGGGAQVEYGSPPPLLDIYGAAAYQQGNGGSTTNSYTSSFDTFSIYSTKLVVA